GNVEIDALQIVLACSAHADAAPQSLFRGFSRTRIVNFQHVHHSAGGERMTAERSSEDNDGHQVHATIRPRGSAPLLGAPWRNRNRRASGLIKRRSTLQPVTALRVVRMPARREAAMRLGQCVSPLRSLRVRRCSLTPAAMSGYGT